MAKGTTKIDVEVTPCFEEVRLMLGGLKAEADAISEALGNMGRALCEYEADRVKREADRTIPT